MLKGLLKIFITLAGLFAAVAGLSYLSRKSADQYIAVSYTHLWEEARENE